MHRRSFSKKKVLKTFYKTANSGLYKPKNPKKYLGDINNIIYRSKLELNWFNWFDKNDLVVSWISEGIHIPYYFEKKRLYYVDIYAEIKTGNGLIKKFLFEIKPSNKINPPKRPSKITKRYLTLLYEYNMNQAKWKYAKSFAEKQNSEFAILTEKDLV